MDFAPILLGVVFLLAANAAPILARNICGSFAERAVDAGRVWRDGRPWFGHHKTWRGLLAAVSVCALLAVLVGLPAWQGALFGLAAMSGDLLSSFCKRRIGLAPGDSRLGLDQLPEALLPLLVLRSAWALDWLDILLAAGLFTLLELAISPLLHRLHIRRRPR